mgnify:FL=1
MNKEELGIYIHIPFCKKKCYYCDFISYCDKNELIDKYIECLKKEIINFSQKYKDVYDITTIYIGGGTPSYINEKYIKNIIDTINNNIVNIKKIKEITIEVNPGTITKEKIEQYKMARINRISIGLQSTNNKLLEEIGRIHDFDEFLETYNMARKVGFKNINVDLMLGLPNQTIKDLSNSVDKIIQLNPEHISIYSLILEENTVLFNLIEQGKLILPTDEVERNMYWYIKNKLELSGYKHYEISNFAKEGYESKHNWNCWEQKQYVGFGVAAHSYLKDKRFSNIENLEQYINNIENDNLEKNYILHENQNIYDKKKEYMLLGLRKIDGVSIQKFKNKFDDNPIYLFRKELKKLIEEDLLEIDGDDIRLTNKGLDLANVVWEEFV